jgi:CoA:oxalate CoA-transferase
MGLEQLISDERFSDPGKRLVNHDELVLILQEVFLQKTAGEWLKLLDDAEVPCAPVNTLDRALNDPQVVSRHMILEFDNPRLNKIRVAGNPVKTHGFAEPGIRPPELGEHTKEVLKEYLNYSDEKIKQLIDEKLIALKRGE